MAHLLIWGKASEMLAGERPTRGAEEVQTFDGVLAALDGKVATLILAEPERVAAEAERVRGWLKREGQTQAVLIAVAEPGEGDAALERLPFVDDVAFRPVTPRRLKVKLERAFERIQQKRVLRQLQDGLERKSAELKSLNDIGVALSAERDIDQLLEQILEKSREITGADAGSLYLVEPAGDNGDPGEAQLRFKLAQNDSVQVSFQESILPLDDNSMAGYAARHAESENVPDVYRQPPHSRYQASRAFDEKSGYRTKSMLMVPMQDHLGQVIGVVQLINKKRSPGTLLQPVEMVEEEVIPFTSVDEQLAGSLASQAAVAFQNAALLKNIRDLFEEFVNAAVNAVEKRDPVTSGHSARVAFLTVGLAEKVDAVSAGPLAEVHFSRDQMEELRYASILHDFGKVAVPEKVLKKGKKLLASELRNVELRFVYRARALEAAYLRRKMEALDSKRCDAAELAALDAEYEEKRRGLELALDAIRLANEPRLVAERGIGALEVSFSAVRKLDVRPFDSEEDEQTLPVEEWVDGPLLSERERDALLIPQGSLTNDERSNEDWGIESHVRHTYEFLQKIPWTGEFRRIPEIAWAHHEKLDGSGYPRKLKGPEQIPVQSRMMTVSDIFDALRAWDRPYKKAASPERALDILAGDVEKGRLDKDLLEVFVKSGIWDAADYLGLLKGPSGKGTAGPS